MGKLFKTVVVGAAAAYFFSTEQGKKLVAKAKRTLEDYTENEVDYRQKAKDYKDLAVNTFQGYKDKVTSGELTKEDVLEGIKTHSNKAVDLAKSSFENLSKKVPTKEVSEETDTMSADENDDIVITLNENDLPDYEPEIDKEEN